MGEQFVARVIDNSLATKARVRTFEKKVAFNKFNYYSTVCCDPEKFPDQDVFKKKLKRCFSDLVVKRGWRYIGFFEKPEGGRLHFHCVAFVPENGMIGEMIQSHDFSEYRHSWAVIESNSFFAEKFGMNSFYSHLVDCSYAYYDFFDHLRSGGKLIYGKGLRSEPEMEEV